MAENTEVNQQIAVKQKKEKTFSFKEYVLNIRNVESRDFGLDVVKVIAMVFVLSVHFFLYNGHYYNYIIGPDQATDFILTTIVRDLFFICVPLFLLVSGALSYYHPADLTKKHFVKITPIIVNSLIIGAFVIIYKLVNATPNVYDPTLTPYRLLQGLWSATLPPYGWYVNMYVTLFVFMPVIDIAYNSLDTQKKKTCMMVVFIVITFVPKALNQIKIEDQSLGVMPSYFCAILWPATYYVIGKYIREFSFKINRVLLSMLLVLCLIYQAIKVYLGGQGKTFYSSLYADNGDLITMITAVCFFLIVYNVNTQNKTVRSIFASLSSLTLSVYLLSWFGDQFFYHQFSAIFNPGINSFGDYFLPFIKIVPLNLVISILASYIVGVLIKLISRPLMKFMLTYKLSNLFNKTNNKVELHNEE